MPWFAIYTKSNTEKRVAVSLQKKGIEVYCPLRKVKRKWSDRVKLIEEPLFRSYCFVRLEEKDRNQVFGVPGVVSYLYWLHKPAIVRDEEIEIIKRMLNDFDHSAIQIQHFAVSDNVTINSGVLMDYEGHVVSQQGKKLLIHLELLGLSVSVDINETIVKKNRLILSTAARSN